MDPVSMLLLQGGLDIGAQVGGGLLAGRNARKAFERNQEMFWKVAEYNSPKNQMARYREAGLNPNLIYGQGTPGNAPQKMPEYMAPEYQITAPNLMSMLGQYQQLKVAAEQEKNISADTANKVTENVLKKIENEIKTIESQNKSYDQMQRLEPVYNPIRKRKTARYVYWNDQLEELNKKKDRILEQKIQQTEKFMEYYDASQIGGIAGDVMKVLAPIFQLIQALRGQNINQAIQMAK